MKITKMNFKGNPYIGLFAYATDKICIVSKLASEKDMKTIKDVLQVDVLQTEIASTNILGVFLAGNSKGFIVPEIVEDSELKFFEENGLKYKIIKGHYTALGNLVAVNDNGCYISETLSEHAEKEIKHFFGDIEYKKSFLGKSELVGSYTVVTNRGFLVNPNIEDDEYMIIEKIFKVKGSASTANYGDPFVKHSVIANSFGAIVGELTSGPELLRIDDGLCGEEER